MRSANKKVRAVQWSILKRNIYAKFCVECDVWGHWRQISIFVSQQWVDSTPWNGRWVKLQTFQFTPKMPPYLVGRFESMMREADVAFVHHPQSFLQRFFKPPTYCHHFTDALHRTANLEVGQSNAKYHKISSLLSTHALHNNFEKFRNESPLFLLTRSELFQCNASS